MMKINWKVRFRNPVFWTSFISALAAFVYTVLALFDVAPAISEAEVIKVVSVIISALTTLGVLVDPTTHGVKDSNRAMTYETPAKS